MRILLCIVVFILMTIPVFSQKQFEGTIVYSFSAKAEKDTMHLVVAFGKNALKLRFEEKNGADKQVMLVRIDSGKIYHLNMGNKTYTTKKLRQQEIPVAVPVNKEILGYATSAADATGNSAISTFAGMLRAERAVFYTADSLFYTMPEKYSLNVELAFLHKGKIVLGTEIRPVGFFPGSDEIFGEREEMKIVVEATSIKWQTFNDSEFSIPTDFGKFDYNLFPPDSMMALDTMVMVDTVIKSPHNKPAKAPSAPYKKPSTPSKKTNPQQNGSIRKPE